MPSHISIQTEWLGTSNASITVAVSPTYQHPLFASVKDTVCRFAKDYGVPSTYTLDGWEPVWWQIDADGSFELRFTKPRGKRIPSIDLLELATSEIMDMLATGWGQALVRRAAFEAQQRAEGRARLVKELIDSSTRRYFGALRSAVFSDKRVKDAVDAAQRVARTVAVGLQAQPLSQEDLAELAPKLALHQVTTCKLLEIDEAAQADMISEAIDATLAAIEGELPERVYRIAVTNPFGG